MIVGQQSKLEEIRESLGRLTAAGFTPIKIYASRSVEAEIEQSLVIAIERTAAKTQPVFGSIEGVPYAVIDEDSHNYAIIVKPV